MARKSVEIIISLKDRVSSALGRIRSGLGSIRAGFTKLAKVGAIAFGALGTAAFALGKTVLKAFDFEKARLQLEVLLGSVSKANARFKELRDFSARTPFQLKGILKASRLMTVFSEGALGGTKSLEAIGDAAAVAGQDISDVAFWVGRAYALIKGGQPFGEAAMRLQEMAILTAKGRKEMEDLQKAGVSSEQVFAVLTREMGRFNGGMEKLSSTGHGLISTLKDNWTIAVATFGEAFAELAKGGLRKAIDTIQELVQNGTIKKWAESARDALVDVAKAAEIIAKSSQGRAEIFKALGGVLKESFLYAASSAADLFLKLAPKIGFAIAQSAADLLNIKLATRQERAFNKAVEETRKPMLGLQYKMEHGKTEEERLFAKTEYAFMVGKLKKLGESAVKSRKELEGGMQKVALDGLSDAFKNLKDVVDEYSSEINDASSMTSRASYASSMNTQAVQDSTASVMRNVKATQENTQTKETETRAVSISESEKIARATLLAMEDNLRKLKSGELSLGGRNQFEARQTQRTAIEGMKKRIEEFKRQARKGDIIGLRQGVDLDKDPLVGLQKENNTILKTIADRVGGVK